jgi:tRNA:m4X modification enzyme
MEQEQGQNQEQQSNQPAQKKVRRNDQHQRVKKKLGDNVTYEDLVRDWTQCCFLIPHKQRLCNMSRSPDSRYCGNHMYLTEEAQVKAVGETTATTLLDERVACPLDPTHTVFVRNLDAHVKKCNAKKYQDELHALPYYKDNCNGGEIVDDCHKQKHVDLEQLVSKVHKVFENVELHPLFDIEQSELYDQIDNAIRVTLGGEQTSFKQTRHTDQDIAIVHQLIKHQLLTPTNFLRGQPNAEEQQSASSATNRDLFLEFGAGKGLLGLAVHVSDPQAYLVFIERSSNRKKVDKTLNDRNFRLFERVRMDIRHCYVPCLPCVQSPVSKTDSKRATIIAKHLCGLASDLAIRSLSHYKSDLPRKRGVGIATCCHHACSFQDYVGKDWLTEQQITIEEFNILKHWSAWATVDRTADYRKPKVEVDSGGNKDISNGMDFMDTEHAVPMVGESMRPKGITHEDMLVVGRKVKRIFDFGRIKYLREVLKMDARLVHYCDSKLSPECVMIVARDV